MLRFAFRVALAACLCLALPADAAPPRPGTVAVDARIELQPNGDASQHLSYRWHPQDYAKIKAAATTPATILRDLTPARSDWEMAPDPACRFDDAQSALLVECTELGAVRNRGDGEWELPIGDALRYMTDKEQEGKTWFYFFADGGGAAPGGQYVYVGPSGATKARWDAGAKAIRYVLPGGTTGKAGRLAVDLRAKERLMTCIYKVYGLRTDFGAMWVAKTVLRNTGEGAVRNLRISYRLDKYADWSEPEKFPELVPGQSVVSVYYPVLDSAIAALRSDTPADLRARWSYEDANGKTEDGEGKRTVLLGRNDFVFSDLTTSESTGSWRDVSHNAPFLAAWVSRSDPVIKEFASWANKAAGGVAASAGPKEALAVLGACYGLLLANDVTYQCPAGVADPKADIEMKLVQNIKFPRDVLRDRSGTCIDLAILLAGMLHEIGLKPYLMVIPGHCFPAVEFPGGQLVAVESTGVGGGRSGNHMDFDTALRAGMKELEESVQSGLYQKIDIEDCWARGIAPPELEALPPDIMQRWKLTGSGGGTGGGGGFGGRWRGSFAFPVREGAQLVGSLALEIRPPEGGRYVAPGRIEGTVVSGPATESVVVEDSYIGNAADGVLDLTGAHTKMSYVGTGKSETWPGFRLRLKAVDGKLVGRIGYDRYIDDPAWSAEIELTPP
ncbi:MAG: hypothetical protein HZA54_12550 [Planctomycetes bacterium]|nr:hypothetical protein [Planctomycetota bacterium]